MRILAAMEASFRTDLRCDANFDRGIGILSLFEIDRAEIATNQMIDDTGANAIAQDIHRRSNSIPEHEHITTSRSPHELTEPNRWRR